MSNDTKTLLAELGIDEVNSGGYDGSWLDTQGELLESVDPTTGQVIASVRQAQADDYERIAERSVEAFHEWRTWPAPKRGEVVRELGNALRDKKDALGRLVTLEMGKILSEGLGEVQEMIDMADLAVGMSRQLYGKTMHSERPEHRMYEQWHPLGPVGIITAFNFPVAVWAWNATVAAVAGDSMIWKPSEFAPLTAIATTKIAHEVLEAHGAPAIFNLAIGDRIEIGERMTQDGRLPLISATGSVAMGRRVGQVVAGRLGRSLLELGGNNGLLVMDDADLDLAFSAILFGAVGTAGQRCTTTRRLFLQRGIADRITERLLKAYPTIRIGDPMDEGTLMGPLVHEKAVGTMMSAIEAAKTQGGELLYGGGRVDREGFFVEPTVVKVPEQVPITCDETFAPILYILEFDDLDQAIAMHNAVPQGLSSSIFTNSMRTAERFLAHTGSDCGIANVNIGTSGAEIGGAFGGEKETGGGREAGSDAWKAYMRRQTNTLNWGTELPLAQGVEFDL
ncbi:MAG: aldehyde dehydrogenase family protein [Thermoanaerobaculia bacterium]|nr:aldehyde dehydrogenase family protein [Thermoanaerobaculia bacterium]